MGGLPQQSVAEIESVLIDRQETDQALSLISFCFEGEKCPGEASPGRDSQAEVTKEMNGEERRSLSRCGGVEERWRSKSGFNLQDFFIPAREWVRGELLNGFSSSSNNNNPWTASFRESMHFYFCQFCSRQHAICPLSLMSSLKTILALKFVLIQDWKLMLRHKTEEVHQKDKVGILRPKI